MTQTDNPPDSAPNLPTLEKVATVMLPAMRLRYERWQRRTVWILAAIFVGLSLLMANSATKAPLRGDYVTAVITGLIVSFAVSLPARWLLLRDLTGIDALVLTGTVYPATMGGSRIDAAAAAAVQQGIPNRGGFVARWSMADRSYSARFTPSGFTPPVQEVAVVANQDHRVLVVLNGKVYSAKRPILIVRSARFPYFRFA